jgi:hypothetical protein
MTGNDERFPAGKPPLAAPGGDALFPGGPDARHAVPGGFDL